MRIVAFIILAHVAIANLLVRRRLPPAHVEGGLFNFSAFKSYPYSLYVSGVTVVFLGIYACVTFIDLFAVQNGTCYLTSWLRHLIRITISKVFLVISRFTWYQ